MKGNFKANENIFEKNTKNLNLHYDKKGWENKDIKDLFDVEILKVGGKNKITDDGIKNMTKVYHLDIQKNDVITDNGICEMYNVLVMSLLWTKKVTNVGIMHMTKIYSLDLRRNYKITDEGIENMTQMKVLLLGDRSKITDDVLRKMHLVHTFQPNNHITNDGIKHMTNMKYLDLHENKKITYDGIKNMKQLQIVNCPSNDLAKSLEDNNQDDIIMNEKFNRGIDKYNKIKKEIDYEIQELANKKSTNNEKNKISDDWEKDIMIKL